MSSADEKTRCTPEQYLALERKSPIKHEYYDGEMFAMAGASRPHNLISGNLFREISSQLLKRPCETYVSDMRVLVNSNGLYTYPDVVVVCGEPQFQDSEQDTLLNPTVIIEVLSASTEAYDRGSKFALYRRLESLREYVLISQDHVLVERYTRQGQEWLLTELNRLEEDSLRLASIDCQVALSEIYARVQFPAGESRDRPDLPPLQGV
jgi:Uma2 family endonuclease